LSVRSARQTTLLAYLQVVLAGALWGTSGPFSIAFHRMEVPPESLALLRPAVGGFFLLVIVLCLKKERVLPSPGPFLTMFAGGGLIVGTFHMAFQLSTASIGVPATVALLYLAPAIVLLASTRIFREPLTPMRGLLGVISVVGVWLTVLGSRGVDMALSPTGIAWGCLTGVGYASYILFGKGFGRHHGPIRPLLWSTLGGVAFLSLAGTISGRSLVLPEGPAAWSLLLLFGFLTVTASSLLLFNAVQTLEAGRAAIGTTVEPLFATLLAILFLDQVLTGTGWLGLALLIVGVAGAYALPPRAINDREAPRSRPPLHPPRDS
jgi:drug/metabolite transporter, DME family